MSTCLGNQEQTCSLLCYKDFTLTFFSKVLFRFALHIFGWQSRALASRVRVSRINYCNKWVADICVNISFLKLADVLLHCKLWYNLNNRLSQQLRESIKSNSASIDVGLIILVQNCQFVWRLFQSFTNRKTPLIPSSVSVQTANVTKTS